MWNKNKLKLYGNMVEGFRIDQETTSGGYRGVAVVLAEFPSERARPYLATIGSKKSKKSL